MRLPSFVGIGAMRSGSTSLWRLLEQHERIFMPELKELHFFDNRWGRWDAGVETYAQHFEAAPPDAVCGEFTPSYMFVDAACERMQAVLPEVRLLVILRNPVDRAWSHYWYMMAWGDEELSFEAALEQEPSRTSGGLESLLKYSYLARGFYHDQLVRVERRFGRDHLCVVLLDELKRDPIQTIERVYRHLGLDLPARPLDVNAPRENSSRRPRIPRVHPALKRAVVWGRGGNTIGHRVGFKVARALREANLAAGTPVMDEALRHRLQAEYADSNRALAGWLGRPVPW